MSNKCPFALFRPAETDYPAFIHPSSEAFQPETTHKQLNFKTPPSPLPTVQPQGNGLLQSAVKWFGPGSFPTHY